MFIFFILIYLIMGFDAPQAVYATQHVSPTDNSSTFQIEAATGKKGTPPKQPYLCNSYTQLELGSVLGGSQDIANYPGISNSIGNVGSKFLNNTHYQAPQRKERKENILSYGNNNQVEKTIQESFLDEVKNIFLPAHLQDAELSHPNQVEKVTRLEKLRYTFYPEFGALQLGDDNHVVGKVTVYYVQENDKLKMKEEIGDKLTGVTKFTDGDEENNISYAFDIDYRYGDTHMLRAYRKFVKNQKIKISREHPGGIKVKRGTTKQYTKNKKQDGMDFGGKVYDRKNQEQIKTVLLDEYFDDTLSQE